jgi:hypothetical protein
LNCAVAERAEEDREGMVCSSKKRAYRGVARGPDSFPFGVTEGDRWAAAATPVIGVSQKGKCEEQSNSKLVLTKMNIYTKFSTY